MEKGTGVDHLTIEMVSPFMGTKTPVPFYLFQLCWQWVYAPLSWWVAQVIPIHKKGPSFDSRSFRPISGIPDFRKIPEKCLQHDFVYYRATLDITQGGFHEAHNSLNQTLCLIEIWSIFPHYSRATPILAFLDIKAAYDTVDRTHIWNTPQPSLPFALLGISSTFLTMSRLKSFFKILLFNISCQPLVYYKVLFFLRSCTLYISTNYPEYFEISI